MHAGLQAVDTLGGGNELGGEVGGGAAGIPGDVDKLWAEVVHALHAFEQVLDTGGGLWGEVLEGPEGSALLLCTSDLVDDLHDEASEGGCEGWKERE